MTVTVVVSTLAVILGGLCLALVPLAASKRLRTSCLRRCDRCAIAACAIYAGANLLWLGVALR